MAVERDSYATGLTHGWDSANYADSYGRDESVLHELGRRAREFPAGDERRAYRDGFLAGYEHFLQGAWPDGQPRDDWPCDQWEQDELPWSCPTCGDELGRCPSNRNFR